MSDVANNKQVDGNHYKKPIQPWDFIHANGMGYLAGNIVKYVSRYQDKNGLVDLYKAKHYLEKLIEEEHKTGNVTARTGQHVNTHA